MSTPTLYEFKFKLPKIQLLDSWRITTSLEHCDDVIWNIVLAYLNSFPVSDKNEINQCIKCLIGDKEVNEDIKHSVETCNPFLHRDADVSNLVNKFKKTVEDYIKTSDRQFQDEPKNFRYLEASSKLLKCNIVLISFPYQKKTLVNLFPVQIHPNTRKIYPKHISILDEFIFTSKNGTPREKFSLCIPKEIGIQKQRQALAEILKRTRKFDNKEKIIQRVTLLPDITEHFLISILKNDFGHVIPFIFESPYVLSKLADAGFETDPRTKDSTGKSAFFHALKTGEWHLVFLLYDHAANACLQTDASVRSPDPVIVENLLCLKDDLKLLENDLRSKEISEKSRCLYRDLCRFNEFQTEIYKSINDVRLKINYYDHTEKEYEALQRKSTILTILKVYETYFDSINVESSINTDDISRFKEFFEHKDYFDKLDFTAAVLFFENLILLKERLLLPNRVYSDVESGFLLFIFCKKYLERYEKQKGFYFVSRWIAFKERLSLRMWLRKLKEHLEEKELFDCIIDTKPDKFVSICIEPPEIYDQFPLSRLQHYLNAATKITVKDIKSILVIERCLQVLSEFCEEIHFNSVQNIVFLVLPEIFIHHLERIRYHTSRMKSRELLHRCNLEQYVELFKGIQNELVKLKQFLISIYSVHEYEMDRFFLKHLIESVQKGRRREILKEHENQLMDILLKMEENQLSMQTANCQILWDRSFDDMDSFLKEEGRNFPAQNVASFCECLRGLLVPNPREDVLDLDRTFRYLEQVVSRTYITTDRKLDVKNRRMRLDAIKELRLIIRKLMENRMLFQKTNKSTYHDNSKMMRIVNRLSRHFPGDFDFKNIERYCEILEGNAVSITEGKLSIHRNIGMSEYDRHLLEHNLNAGAARGTKTEFITESKGMIPQLNLKEIEERPKNTELKLNYDSSSIDSCYSFLDFKSKNVLSNLVPGQNKKVPVNRFEFFRSRIKILKNILIDENDSIQLLWDMATTPRRKVFAKEKIVQLYLNDSEMQASVEMLLFQCKTILRTKELEQLWEKTTNMFNGINLRNVLAHGHPLLESLGRLPDPCDLPSELVEKMLKLISDKYVIECMQEILDKSETNFSGFMQIMNDEEDEQFKNLREQIRECQHWKQYALLIPFQK